MALVRPPSALTDKAEGALVSQTSGGGEQPYPLGARVCIAFGWFQVFASLVVWYIWGIGELMDPVDEVEILQFHNAKVMLLPAMLLESCYLISSRNSMSQISLHGHDMSYLVILEYCVKMACYSTMAHFNGGIVHKNLRALGPLRGCYTVRFLEWSIAVPTLLTINNYPLAGSQAPIEFARRLLPNLFVTWAYILASWVAEVTPDAYAGWFLVILSFVAYLAAIWDQVDIVLEADRGLHGFGFKIGVVVLKEIVFFVYGVVYLLGIANLISSFSEQVFYTYGDVMLKVVQASVLVVVRNWEDLALLQRALEQKVEAGKEDMSRLFRRANAPIFAISQEGFVVAWNEHLARVSSILEQNAVGKSILEFIQDDSKNNFKLAIESCWSGLSHGAVEVTLKRQSEEQQPVQMLLTLIVQLGTNPGKTITAIGQDLTELAAMKAMQERKARFTAVLGHELRSPLHGIMGLSGSMAEGTSNPMQKRQLSMIKGCAARLLDLVTNIMEMAKAEKLEASGAQAIELRLVNIMDIVDEVIGMTEMAVDKNGRHLVGSNVMMVNNMCTTKLPMVMGDSYKITQLLYNLVTNAAKFTAAGSIQLSARECPDRNMLEIDVSDTGKGIAPEALKKIFEPFQQEENKDSRSFQGIGLGLSVAMSIAKLHGGEIRVMSKCGQGSTFTVCLPCDFSKRAGLTLRAEDGTGMAKSRAAKHVAALSMRVAPPGGVTPPTGLRPLILSVDDDDINQEVIEQTFGSDYRVVRAMTGMEAFEYLDSGKEYPSLMLLDVMMPGLSGFEVVRDIRNKRSLCHTQLPVVMLSARSPQEATATEAFESGATDYMQKPFSSVILKNRLSVIDEVRQEIRKAQIAAVESYKEEQQRNAQEQAAAKEAAKPPEEAAAQEAKGDAAAPGETKPPLAPTTPRPPATPRVADERERLETMTKLQQERDLYRQRIEAAQGEAGKSQQELKRVADEKARLAAELEAARAKATAATAMNIARQVDMPGFATGAASVTPSMLSLRSDLDFAECSADFYKGEVDLRTREITTLREKVDRNKSQAWLQRERADALDRELRFVRRLQQPLLATDAIDFSPGAGNEY